MSYLNEEAKVYSDFAYDDAFRTIETYCDDVVIDYINYFFGESFSRSAKISRYRNEHFVTHEDHSEEKDITDSHITVSENGITKRYHFECESGKYNGSLLVKMFRYDSQIAIDSGTYSNARLYVDFPYSGLLMLRSGKNTPDSAQVFIHTPGGEISYDIPIMKVSDFSIDDLFDKKLYFLIPFYIFNLESEIKKNDTDDKYVSELADTYRMILSRLEDDVLSERLSTDSNDVIILLTHKVLFKLTMNSVNTQRKVGGVMGGKVLELDYIKGIRDGREQGREEGIEQGIEQGTDSAIQKLANHYMKENPELSEKEALEMAAAILR